MAVSTAKSQVIPIAGRVGKSRVRSCERRQAAVPLFLVRHQHRGLANVKKALEKSVRKAGTRQSERRLHAYVRACLGVCVCRSFLHLAFLTQHTGIIDEGQGEAVCESSTVAAVLCVSDTVPVAPPHGSSQCVLVASDSKRCAVFFLPPIYSLVQLPASKQSLPGL